MPKTGVGHLFTLGLDLDGVTGDYESALRDFAMRTTGRPASSYPPPAHWDMVACGWFDSQQEFLDTHAAAVADGMFAAMPAMAGASKALHELSDAGVRILVITHRLLQPGAHRRVVSDTVAFLDEHDIPYSDLCFVADKTTVGCDVLLDDAPHNVLAARAAGVPTLVFDQLYNRAIAGPRALDWWDAKRQILEFFDDWKHEQEHLEQRAAAEPASPGPARPERPAELDDLALSEGEKVLLGLIPQPPNRYSADEISMMDEEAAIADAEAAAMYQFDPALPELHIGRSLGSRRHFEDACPCPQEPCGLIAVSRIDPSCEQHRFRSGKTIRQTHTPDQCDAMTAALRVASA